MRVQSKATPQLALLVKHLGLALILEEPILNLVYLFQRLLQLLAYFRLLEACLSVNLQQEQDLWWILDLEENSQLGIYHQQGILRALAPCPYSFQTSYPLTSSFAPPASSSFPSPDS